MSVAHASAAEPTPASDGASQPWWRNPLWVGIAAAVILWAASFGGGAVRSRGGALEALGLSFIAFGHGRNISMLLFWVGIFALVYAWALAGRRLVTPTLRAQDRQPAEPVVPRVQRLLWCWVVPLLFAGPLASRDVYSYLMQGAMVRDGFNPYEQGAAANPGPYLLEVSHDWRNTTTPYGPLHLWTGDIISSVVGDNVTAGVIAYKVVSVLGFALIAWAVPHIARALGGNPALALWLGVANPVMLIHLIGGMHNESVMVGLVSVGLVFALRKRFLTAIALVAVATALKVTAFFAMPFILWIFIHSFASRSRDSWLKPVAAFLGGGVLIVVETIAVVAAITWASGSSWGWLSEITGNSKVINPLAAPTLAADILVPILQVFSPDVTYNGVLGIARTISMALMLIGLVVVWCLSYKNRRAAVLGMTAAYCVALVFNSVTLPWYYASVISVAGVARPPRWMMKLATAASFFVAVSFSGDGNHQLYNWWWVIAAAVAAWWCAEWIFQDTPRGAALTAAPEPAASAS